MTLAITQTTVWTCDRNGTTVTHTISGTNSTDRALPSGWVHAGEFDLCSDCVTQIQAFIAGSPGPFPVPLSTHT